LRTILFTLALASAFVLASASPASADEIAFTGNIHIGSPQNGGTNPNGRGRQTLRDFTLGTNFRVVTELVTITSLGVWDDNGDGLLSPHKVLIFDAGNFNPILAEVDTTAGGGVLRDGYRYFDLDEDLILFNGQEFTLAVYYSEDNLDSNGNSGKSDQNFEPRPDFNPGFGPALEIFGDSSYGFGQVYPGIPDTGPADRYHAGSFEYVPNPEPGTLVLMGGAAAAAAAARRRRRRKLKQQQA